MDMHAVLADDHVVKLHDPHALTQVPDLRAPDAVEHLFQTTMSRIRVVKPLSAAAWPPH